MPSLTFRDQIYRRYASVFRGRSLTDTEMGMDSWGDAFSRYLKGWLPPDQDARILDLGCGDGRLLHLLSELGYHCLEGVDISAEQVELARRVMDSVVHEDVITYLENSNQPRDVIFALDIVEHLDKDEAFRFLSGCARRLVSGGYLILSTPNGASPMFGFSRYGDFTHEICFTPQCLRQILRLFGFDHVHFREIGPYPHGLRSTIRTGLWRTLRLGIRLWNLVEVGHDGGGVYTRNFLARARKLRSAPIDERPRR